MKTERTTARSFITKKCTPSGVDFSFPATSRQISQSDIPQSAIPQSARHDVLSPDYSPPSSRNRQISGSSWDWRPKSHDFSYDGLSLCFGCDERFG
jgi:hypothetical protein